MHLLFCFSTFFVFLLVNTCLADSTIPTDEPLAGFLSNLDPSLGVAKPNGGTNSDNLFMSNTPNSDSTTLGSEVPIINDKFDSALFGNSPGSTDISNNDDPGLDLWATTGESCVPDSTHHVNKRNEACSPKDAGAVLGGQDKPTQQGVLTGEAIEQLFKTLAYGLDLHTEDDYTWCGGTKYAVCDSGYEFDRVLRLPPLFALYDCSHYSAIVPCNSPKKVWCCEWYWFSLDFKGIEPDVADNCEYLFSSDAWEIPKWSGPF